MASGNQDDEAIRSFEQPDSDLPQLPTGDDDSFLHNKSEVNRSVVESEGSALMEKEMRRRLMDMESSFLPDVTSGQGMAAPSGVDDTYIFGGTTRPNREQRTQWPLEAHQEESDGIQDRWKEEQGQDHDQDRDQDQYQDQDRDPDYGQQESSSTPADAYKTPAARLSSSRRIYGDANDTPDYEEGVPTSDDVPSSPLAAAAQRNASRVEVDTRGDVGTSGPSGVSANESQRAHSRASTIKATDPTGEDDSLNDEEASFSMAELSLPTVSRIASSTSSLHVQKRPHYVRNRYGSQRSSLSSIANQSDVSGDGTSEGTLGADYALQSGGAVSSFHGQGQNRASMALSRLPSLGSIASSMSGEDSHVGAASRQGLAKTPAGVNYAPAIGRGREAPDLRSASGLTSALPIGGGRDVLSDKASVSQSPTKGSSDASAPSLLQQKLPITLSDTIISKQVSSIKVPFNTAREFNRRQLQGKASNMESMESFEPAAVTSPYKNPYPESLSLKEQNSKIESLSKENFALKLKIYFLDDTLAKRSDEHVQKVVDENVRLQAALVVAQKTIKDLNRKVLNLQEGTFISRPSTSDSHVNRDSSESNLDLFDYQATISKHEEVISQHETTIATLQSRLESQSQEHQEQLQRVYGGTTSFRDMENTPYDAGVANSDEDEAKKTQDRFDARVRMQSPVNSEVRELREQVRTLEKQFSEQSRHLSLARNVQRMHATPSQILSRERDEIIELNRKLNAQASMLASRNRERESLQTQIEELKSRTRYLDPTHSVSGDSILDRSVSRANLRHDGTASSTTLADQERDLYEEKHVSLRNELLKNKMITQDLERELNEHLDQLETTEADMVAFRIKLEQSEKTVHEIQLERDELIQIVDLKDTEFNDLEQEALAELQDLEDKLDTANKHSERLEQDLNHRNEDFVALQSELRSVSNRVIQLEDGAQAKSTRIDSLEENLRDAQNVIDSLERNLQEANNELIAMDDNHLEVTKKNEHLQVQLETLQDEKNFLREEQEGDKMKIGELETNLSTCEASLQEQTEKVKDMEKQYAEEKLQREAIDSHEKSEIQKFIDDLNTQLFEAKDETRKLKTSVTTKEVEAETWKTRLTELEATLKQTLGSLDGTKSSWAREITNIQTELDTTIQGLRDAKNEIAERERLLRNRDTLLESAGLETRRVKELLEKERQGRRQDRHQQEQTERASYNMSLAQQKQESRIAELEKARQSDRRKAAAKEIEHRDQLMERHNLLLAVWNRLSTLCGADWARQNSLINGELPSVEVIGKHLPAFSKNLILSVKCIEGVIGMFRTNMRQLERDLMSSFQTLEHTLDIRSKRIDGLEKVVLGTSPSKIPKPASTKNSIGSSLLRQHSTDAAEPTGEDHNPVESDRAWMSRLQELERRLKAEREARLLDRSGARRRLEEERTENEELRKMLEREKSKRVAE